MFFIEEMYRTEKLVWARLVVTVDRSSVILSKISFSVLGLFWEEEFALFCLKMMKLQK